MSVFHFEVVKGDPEKLDYNYVAICEGCWGDYSIKLKAKSKADALRQADNEIRGKCNHVVLEIVTRKMHEDDVRVVERNRKKFFKKLRSGGIELPVVKGLLPSLVLDKVAPLSIKQYMEKELGLRICKKKKKTGGR
jgi:hypothetical protein